MLVGHEEDEVWLLGQCSVFLGINAILARRL
jgi:hypothetical protein